MSVSAKGAVSIDDFAGLELSEKDAALVLGGRAKAGGAGSSKIICCCGCGLSGPDQDF